MKSTLREVAQKFVDLHATNVLHPAMLDTLAEYFREALDEPAPEPVALPCCGYKNASAIKWNPHNQAVQCHNCGQVYTAPTPRRPLRDEEVDQVLERHAGGANWSDAEYRSAYALARAIEEAIWKKNS